MTANLLISVEILWKGMAGTFIVSAIVIVMVKALSKLIRDKPGEV
ncbi:hypothetical protein AGMMS50293_28070 [Spirochaetia bacterium]|nr:hypothetical protein AGMMS50293_28070 [Spirochaetia bacterium]